MQHGRVVGDGDDATFDANAPAERRALAKARCRMVPRTVCVEAKRSAPAAAEGPARGRPLEHGLLLAGRRRALRGAAANIGLPAHCQRAGAPRSLAQLPREVARHRGAAPPVRGHRVPKSCGPHRGDSGDREPRRHPHGQRSVSRPALSQRHSQLPNESILIVATQ